MLENLMKRLLLLLSMCCTPSLAAELTLVIPQLSKGRAAEGDGLSARYDAAWAKYERAIGKVVADVTQALDDEFNKAADAGSLESADMWDKKKKAFLESNAVTCEIPDKPKASARKKPTPDAPKTFPEILQAAQQETDTAVSALKSDYETLIREYTKARNLERAKQLKEEVAGFATASAERPKMVSGKEAAAPKSLAERLKKTAWINENQAKWEWDEDGVLTRNGQPGLKWRPVDERTIYVVFGPDHTDTLIFNDDLTEYRQYYRTLKPEPGAKPILTGRRLRK